MSISEIEIPNDRIARTLTCDIKIALKPQSDQPLITDCGFLRHNHAAEELYGCPLTYRYKSQFRDKDATLHAQCRMVASRQGHTDYNSSSLNYLLRADGEGVWVRQDVVTYQDDGVTYWLTALYPSSQPGLVAACNLNEYGVTLAEVQAVCGRFTIADIQALPEDLTTVLAISNTIPENVQASNVEGQSSLRLTAHHGSWAARWLHFCHVCGWIWSSKVRRPSQCAYRKGCASEVWWRRP